VALIIIISLVFINLYSYQSIFQGKVHHRIAAFIYRTALNYGVTFCVVFLVLLALNRMPVLDEPIVALKRIIILSFPASMGAVVVDSFDKE